MTTSLLAASLLDPVANVLKKKRVLLVDASPATRDLRAETMRKLGVDVDCAADISEARSWWRASLYNLVLMNVENDLGHRDRFCEDVRNATPPQSLAFLVGGPDFLAHLPVADDEPSVRRNGDYTNTGDVKAAMAANISGDLGQRWGILEASRRISAVRSLSHARTKARQDRPAPPRDSEIRLSKRPNEPRTLDQLLREEMQ
ncbi:MAG TPA: response regulator [Candidatus Sulfotelmatobacter sp.]|nr:response regulator [Candidatus Sulfotelmatobacter sp.]